jgi:shikimate kinase
MNLLFLVGMPAVGKSHWGKTWAKQHDYEFTDIDDHIEIRAGLSIPDIFRSVGLEGFRTLEGYVLLDAISTARAGSGKAIIATGGGTPTHGDNMGIMLRSGCVVRLTANVNTILQHIDNSNAIRPLLQNCDAASLERLREEREPYYSRAHISVAVENIRHDTFDQIINQCTNLRSPQAF